MKNNKVCVNLNDEQLKKIEAIARKEARTITNVIYNIIVNNLDYALSHSRNALETYQAHQQKEAL